MLLKICLKALKLKRYFSLLFQQANDQLKQNRLTISRWGGQHGMVVNAKEQLELFAESAVRPEAWKLLLIYRPTGQTIGRTPILEMETL